MKQNIMKQLSMCVAVYELLTVLFALELALPREILKHMHSMQYQFNTYRTGLRYIRILISA